MNLQLEIFLKSRVYCVGQIYGGDFAKFCGVLRIYELWKYEFEWAWAKDKNKSMYLESKWIEILCISNNNAKLTWLGVAFFSPTWPMKVNARYIIFFRSREQKKVSSVRWLHSSKYTLCSCAVILDQISDSLKLSVILSVCLC